MGRLWKGCVDSNLPMVVDLIFGQVAQYTSNCTGGQVVNLIIGDLWIKLVGRSWFSIVAPTNYGQVMDLTK